MPKFAANISLLFAEVPFPQRIARAAKAGFRAVECQFPFPFGAELLAAQLDEHQVSMVLHNLPAGDFPAGDRGVAVHPERVGEFQDGVGQGLAYAKALGCRQLNCLVGLRPEGVPEEKIRATVVDNLRFAAKALAKEEIRLLVEPLNSQDIPGFYLVYSRDTLQLFKEVNHPNIHLQYDIFHMQIMEGNLTRTIRDNLASIAHMQFADNPGRHEPGTGEINYPNLFQFIDESGYDGWIGAEYNPAGKTEEGLDWFNPYRKAG